jgi:hypothetical protein
MLASLQVLACLAGLIMGGLRGSPNRSTGSQLSAAVP